MNEGIPWYESWWLNKEINKYKNKIIIWLVNQYMNELINENGLTIEKKNFLSVECWKGSSNLGVNVLV